jgi:hypothetical protein
MNTVKSPAAAAIFLNTVWGAPRSRVGGKRLIPAVPKRKQGDKTRLPKSGLPIVQSFCLVIALLIIGLWSVSASAARIKTARNAQTHGVLFGVTVEGEIERGDSVKLLNELMMFDVSHVPEVARYVFLRSKGGDVEEAMKMGTLIRQLRLVTEAPTKFDDKPLSTVLLADKKTTSARAPAS